MNTVINAQKKITFTFNEINKLNKFSKVVNDSEFLNTILNEKITVVQSEVSGINLGLRVTYSMVTVYSLTGIEYIVYKRITGDLTEVRKLYIGE